MFEPLKLQPLASIRFSGPNQLRRGAQRIRIEKLSVVGALAKQIHQLWKIFARQ